MPLYMDVHDAKGLTDEKVAAIHKKDLAAQGKHGVKFVKYWFDQDKGKVFCLSQAPNPEATLAVHKETGAPTNEIYQVHEGS